MKKGYYVIIGAVLVLLAGLALWFFGFSDDINDDALKFREEYESYNNKKSATGEKYEKLKIEKKNKIKYATYDEVIDLIENDTALIYLGRPDSNECRKVVNTLLKEVNNSELKNLIYLDMTNKKLNDFKDYINEDNEDELEIPLIIGVVDGEVKDILKLNANNSNELHDLINLINEDKPAVCDETC